MRQAYEYQREEILSKAFDFVTFSIEGNRVKIIRSDCEIFLEVTTLKNLPVVVFEYFPVDETEEPVTFWLNKSSMSSLGAKLRGPTARRMPWDEP